MHTETQRKIKEHCRQETNFLYCKLKEKRVEVNSINIIIFLHFIIELIHTMLTIHYQLED